MSQTPSELLRIIANYSQPIYYLGICRYECEKDWVYHKIKTQSLTQMKSKILNLPHKIDIRELNSNYFTFSNYIKQLTWCRVYKYIDDDITYIEDHDLSHLHKKNEININVPTNYTYVGTFELIRGTIFTEYYQWVWGSRKRKRDESDDNLPTPPPKRRKIDTSIDE